MKLNNKGFAISTVMYMILIMAIILITLTLSLLSSRKLVLDKIKSKTKDNIYLISENLPSEYQQVEYIESDGTEYILTDIIPDDTTGIEIEFSVSDITGDTVFFGSRSTDAGRFWIGQNGGALYYSWNTTTAIVNRPSIENDQRITVRMNYNNDRTRVFNGAFHSNITTKLADNTSPIAIFAANNKGSISYSSKIKLYKFKITRGISLIAYFIPCYKVSNGTQIIGLYDVINNKFYTNDGTGVFEKGTDVVKN